MSIEIVEIDYRPFMSRDGPPVEVEADLRRCNVLWVSHPQIPKNPGVGTMHWGWGWRGWQWVGEPNIPRQAIFDEVVSVRSANSEDLVALAEDAMTKILQQRPQRVSFALFLRVGEKFSQGIVPGEPGFTAQLRRSYVLLGHQ